MSVYRDQVEVADQLGGRTIVESICPACSGKRQVVATVVDTRHGALLRSEIPSKGATRIRRAFAEADGEHERVALRTDPIRELIEWQRPDGSVEPLPDLRSHCPRHGLVDIRAAVDAVAVYRATGKRQTVVAVVQFC